MRFTSLLVLLIGGSFAICPRNAVCQKQVGFTQVVLRATPVVTLRSSVLTAPWGTSLTFTAKLTGSGIPPSGTVTFRNGTSQLGTVTLNLSGIATYSTSALGAGSHSIMASYEGDLNYAPTTSLALVVSVIGLTPSVRVTPFTASIATAQSLTVAVEVSGGTGDPVPTGSIILTSGSYAPTASVLADGLSIIDVPAGALAVGADTLTASYTPDAASSSTYNSASNTALVTVAAPTPGFAISGTFVTVAPGATTGNTSTITVTPKGGYTGSVALTAAITSSPVGALDLPTLSFGSSSPVILTAANAGTASLTISTTAATSGTLAYPKRHGAAGYATGGATLACLLLFGIPVRRRRRQSMLGLLLLLLTVAGGVTACGGGWYRGSSSGGGKGNRRTTAGTYTVTVTGTSGTTTATGMVTLTVE
jgi:trimeric autotransporter adhesin